MNTIKKEQNNFTDLISAQRQAYSIAKRFGSIQNLMILVSFLMPLLIFIGIKDDIKLYVGLISLLGILGITQIFKNRQSKYVETGAKIQEKFDTELYKISINPEIYKNMPGSHEIASLSNKIPENKKPKDWYESDIPESLPQNIAVLFCMEENLWWDGFLRKAHANSFLVLMSVYYLTITTLSLKFDISLSDYIYTQILPTGAFIKFCLENYIKQYQIFEMKEDLKSQLQVSFEDFKKNNNIISDTELRQYQNKIYKSRNQTTMVPNWFYKLLKNKQSKVAQKAGEIKLNELKRQIVGQI